MRQFLYGIQIGIILAVFFIARIYVELDWYATIEAIITISLFSAVLILVLALIILKINKILLAYHRAKK